MGAVDAYTGIDNLEIMAQAENYQRYLVQAVTRGLAPASRPQRILDFGAGSGTMARALRELGYPVTCLEPDAQLRWELSSAHFECSADLEELHAGGSFDAVYSMNVLEHIDDDSK